MLVLLIKVAIPFWKLQVPQFCSSVLSLAPQSLVKSQILFAGTQVLSLHLIAQGLGVDVGLGAGHFPGVTTMSSKAMSPRKVGLLPTVPSNLIWK